MSSITLKYTVQIEDLVTCVEDDLRHSIPAHMKGYTFGTSDFAQLGAKKQPEQQVKIERKLPGERLKELASSGIFRPLQYFQPFGIV